MQKILRFLGFFAPLALTSPKDKIGFDSARSQRSLTEMKVKTMVNLMLIIFYLTFEFVQVPALAIKLFVVDVT